MKTTATPGDDGRKQTGTLVFALILILLICWIVAKNQQQATTAQTVTGSAAPAIPAAFALLMERTAGDDFSDCAQPG